MSRKFNKPLIEKNRTLLRSNIFSEKSCILCKKCFHGTLHEENTDEFQTLKNKFGVYIKCNFKKLNSVCKNRYHCLYFESK